MRGWALAEQGWAEEGINELLQGLATMQSYESELRLMYHRTMLAEAYGRGGQAKEGLFMLIQALAGVHQDTVRHYEAELHRLKGELSLQQALQRGDTRTVPEETLGGWGRAGSDATCVTSANRGGNLLWPCPQDRPTPKCEVSGAAGGDEFESSVATRRQVRGSPPDAGRDLWLVHRGF